MKIIIVSSLIRKSTVAEMVDELYVFYNGSS